MRHLFAGILRRGQGPVVVRTVPFHVRSYLCYRSLQPSNNEKLADQGEKPAEVAGRPSADVRDRQSAFKSL